MEILSRHVVGDMVAVYRTQDGAVDLVLHPVGLAPVVHRDAPEAEAVEGLVHLHVRGDSLANRYVSGRSMRCGGTILHLVGHDIGEIGRASCRERVSVVV